MSKAVQPFSAAGLEQFARDGYVIVRSIAAPETVSRMLELARHHLDAHAAPLEYEADLSYPGAPPSREAPGGRTVRRLLQAYARNRLFREWATSDAVRERLEALLGPEIELSQAHHNCIMTKSPRYSSATGWHQDIRYWAFERLLLPGTHRMRFAHDRLDAAKFLRTNLDENRALLATEVAAELDPGDVLFFHCRLFHAAGQNQTQSTKYSLVFTYHAAGNRPLAGTRSSALPDIALKA